MPETADMRVLARRVKKLALEKAEYVLSHPEEFSTEVYDQTYLTVLKNAVPRTQEITGEDGQALIIQIASEVAVKNDINESDSSTSTNSQEFEAVSRS